jgi:mannosyltransferase
LRTADFLICFQMRMKEKLRTNFDVPERARSLWPAPKVYNGGPFSWGWLAVLTVGAAVLRGISLNQQLWFDEMVALVNSVRLPLKAILTTYTSQNQHTLYSILAHFSVSAFGEHPWTLRLPAVAFGVACVPALYLLCRLVTTDRESLLASAMLAVSYHHVWFSQNGRGYTAMLFWTLLGTYLFIRGAKCHSRTTWIAYAIVMTLGLYTHLTMGFVILGHALVYAWLVAARYRTEGHLSQESWWPLMSFTLTGLLTLALYAPMLSQLLSHTVEQNGPPVHWEWKNPVWLVLSTFRGLKMAAGGSLLLLAAVAFIVATGVFNYWRQDRVVVALIILPMLITTGALLALKHNLWPRFYFFAIGFAFLFLMRGAIIWGQKAAQFARRGARAGLAWEMSLGFLLVAGSIWTLPPAWRYPKQDFLGAMRLIDAQRQPGEPVVVVGLSAFAYRSYYRRDWQPVATAAELESVRAQGKRTWLVYTLPIYLKSREPQIWEAIQTEFAPVKVFRGTLSEGEVVVCEASAEQERKLATRSEP